MKAEPPDESSDALPHRDADRIHTLYAHYFLAADLMRRQFDKLAAKLRAGGRLSLNKEVEGRIFFWSWVGFLAVTSEGFRDLKPRLVMQRERPEMFAELVPRCDALNKATKRHEDTLRRVRNGIFHLREDTAAMDRFLNNETLDWARELHDAFAEFFSEYRILCEVHYVLHDRMSESAARRRRPA